MADIKIITKVYNLAYTDQITEELVETIMNINQRLDAEPALIITRKGGRPPKSGRKKPTGDKE